jgi:predicted nucleic acid-binding protein
VPVGALGVLVLAKDNTLIPEVKPLIDRLRDELNFFVSDRVRETAIRLAGEA